jgi:hypothetical protein
MTNKITVEVAYALPELQKIVQLQVDEGTLAIDAAKQSGLEKVFPEIVYDGAKMGLFGKAIKPLSHVLVEGDRVEIYRPLISDPKATRKARADKGKAAK